MTDMVMLLVERGGIRHYHEEPNAADRTRREHRRRWPWHEMRVNDYMILDNSEEEFDRTFLVAKSAASQYGKNHGMTFRSWTIGIGGLIYREK